MKIALVSFEYDGVRGGGGIGTYVRHVVKMLTGAGHRVHVFTAGTATETLVSSPHLAVSSVQATRESFPEAILSSFSCEQRDAGFDVIEGPEYGCDAKAIADAYPHIPLVVRLHGPTFSIMNSNAHYVPRVKRWRFGLGALRRGHWPTDPWRRDPTTDPERAHALQADEIVANSKATAEYCTRTWALPFSRLSVVPLPFVAPTNLLALRPAPRSRTILFLGRLEVRKGVLELARAVPMVLIRHPDVTFRFVGEILPHINDGQPLSRHIRRLAGGDGSRVEIVDGVPNSAIVNEFAHAAVCVFPSDWEASGFVCLEGMAAGRAVVASRAGGMSEIIEDGSSGILVSHRDPAAIAGALNRLLASPDLCLRLGEAGRKSVIQRYAPETILPLHLAAYQRAIANARGRMPKQRYCTT